MLRFSRKHRFLVKITLIVFVSFLIIAAVMWFFFKSTARNIGYYIATGKKNTAVVLITEYLGNPPSKIKAKILSNFYGIAFEYYDNGVLKWIVGRKLDFSRGVKYGINSKKPAIKNMMKNEHFEQMHRMMRGMLKREIYLGEGRLIKIHFPAYPHRKIFIFPVVIIFFIVISIAILIFFMIKRTLLPVQKLIDASQKIGNGDLSYRLNYYKEDEFKNVVNAFNTMAEKLENMLKSQRDLLHMISHELRTPLSRISLALELGDFKRSKTIIKLEIKEIDELIESIMELSRLEDEEIGVEKNDLVEIIYEIIRKYENINFDVKMLTSNAIVKGKRILLEKAIGNIIDNAVKYTDKKTPINIELYRDNSHFVFKVINSGKGLSEDEIKMIFKPFYRAKNARLGSTDGKGLGLVVANRIIEGIGGTIECKSVQDGPTEFIITIPICRDLARDS